MPEYVKKTLFIHQGDSEGFIDRLKENSFGVEVKPVEFSLFHDDPAKHLKGYSHVVVLGPLGSIKVILDLAVKYKFSVGVLPQNDQRNLIRCYELPRKTDAAIELALRQDCKAIDLIYCNGKIMLFKAAIGRTPLLDSPTNAHTGSIIFQALRKMRGLKLLGFSFSSSSGRKIKTAASGCMIVQHHEGTLASKLISHDSSLTDGMISLVIAAPFSVLDYLKLIGQIIIRKSGSKKIAKTLGLIKSKEIDIESEFELDVVIDDQSETHTPLHCHTVPEAVKINIGTALTTDTVAAAQNVEKINIDNLPKGKEIAKAKNEVIPFFSYASEERFKELFTALHDDANISWIYMILMLLSTILATVGLYLNSSSVIIGAMLLAPLMAPIVSLAMGLLRQNTSLLKYSFAKIILGVALALAAAAVTTFLLPYQPVTSEMQARLNPSLLDLSVAIVAGVAGAYTKSYKEILQSLAGVAIAVALVPPLAVAGIGLGRMDLYFFGQAFLLFSTNLIGIVLAATITFRVLGYSSAIKDKKRILFVCAMFVLIAIPLYFSYVEIVEKHEFEQAWKRERFFVNGKYLIIHKATILESFDKDVITMDIHAREKLTREDMLLLKKKIQRNFTKRLIIRARIIYIL